MPDQSEWDEYQLWLERKKADMRWGSMLAIFNLVAGSASLFVQRTVAGGSHNDSVIAVAISAYLAGIFGTALIRRAKELDSGWILLSLVCGPLWLVLFLMPDQNIREVPNKASTGFKPEGSVFSDW